MCASSSRGTEIILLLVCWLIVQLKLCVHCFRPMQGWLASRLLPSCTVCSLANNLGLTEVLQVQAQATNLRAGKATALCTVKVHCCYYVKAAASSG